MTDQPNALLEALEPFAKLARPINGEAGRPTYLEAISGPNGTDELQLSTMVGDGTRVEILDAEDFRRADRALRDALSRPTQPSGEVMLPQYGASLSHGFSRSHGPDDADAEFAARWKSDWLALREGINHGADEGEAVIRRDERKKIIAQGCIHTRKASEQEKNGGRADIRSWQEAQGEWFDPTICEIVSEYAAWRDSAWPERLKYDGDVMEAVQRLIERGRATLDSEGYLVAHPPAHPTTPARETVEAAAKVASKRHEEWKFAIDNGLRRVAVSAQYAAGAANEAALIALAISALSEPV